MYFHFFAPNTKLSCNILSSNIKNQLPCWEINSSVTFQLVVLDGLDKLMGLIVRCIKQRKSTRREAWRMTHSNRVDEQNDVNTEQISTEYPN